MMLDTPDLNHLFCRFISGGESNKSLFNVSRLQLAIANCGLYSSSCAPKMLLDCVNAFINAEDEIKRSNKITLESISRVNSIIQRKNGIAPIRYKGIKVVDDSGDTLRISGLSESEIRYSLQELLEDINHRSEFNVERAIYLYCKMLEIHPFCDGNGRLSRVLFNTLVVTSDLSYLNIALYQYHADISEISEETINRVSDESSVDLNRIFWKKYFDWNAKVTQSCKELISTANSNILNKLFLTHFSASEILIIKHLWNYPVLTLKKASELLKSTPHETFNTLTRLESLGIITSKPFGKDNPVLLYVCNEVINALLKMDRALLQTTPRENVI